MRARTVEAVAVAYEFICRYCRETLPSPSGSLFWDRFEVQDGEVRACPHCRRAVRLPKLSAKPVSVKVR